MMQVGTIFPTKFDTVCRTCGIRIEKRTRVRYLGKGRIECEHHAASPISEPVELSALSEEPKPPASAALEALANELTPLLEQRLKIHSQGESVDKDTVADIVIELLDKRPPLEIQLPDKPSEPMPDCAHSMLPKILTMLTLKKDFHLYDGKKGGPGSGKSYAVEQASKILYRRYHCITLGPATSEAALFGYFNAAGTYTSTMFRDFVEHGGTFVLEEIGLAHDAVITCLNSGLANGAFSFPDGMVKRHPDFVLVSIDQTNLRTLDDRYARRPHDVSFINRLKYLAVDYDDALEFKLALAGLPEEKAPIVKQWVKWVQAVREDLRSSGCSIFPTPRDSIDGALLFAGGYFSAEEVADMCVFKSIIDDDTRARVLASHALPKA